MIWYVQKQWIKRQKKCVYTGDDYNSLNSRNLSIRYGKHGSGGTVYQHCDGEQRQNHGACRDGYKESCTGTLKAKQKDHYDCLQ